MDHIPFNERIAAAIGLAEMPELLFPQDIAAHLRLPLDEARDAVEQGLLGPWITVRGEPVVMRDAFVAHLKLHAAQIRVEDREVLP